MDVYAVGLAGTILHSKGDGKWAPQNSGIQLSLQAVGGRSACDVWVAGGAGTILRSDGNGAWVKLNPVVFFNLHAITTTATDVFLAGVGGTLLHSSGGAPMTEASGTSAALNGLVTAGGAVFAIGQSQTILKGGP